MIVMLSCAKLVMRFVWRFAEGKEEMEGKRQNRGFEIQSRTLLFRGPMNDVKENFHLRQKWGRYCGDKWGFHMVAGGRSWGRVDGHSVLQYGTV